VELLIVVERLVSDENPRVQLNRIAEPVAQAIEREWVETESLAGIVDEAVDDDRFEGLLRRGRLQPRV
jgi:hypothetical protein